ncbi:M23 family metallopeptidase [Corynebacterium alimapuense]|uniref:M23 family peptidase n=1 Tax=Corynebacterium alimapuense TaxID=1576874 RepID=A0A3M8K8B7_9CORY|nr:M23 family metallopeptidase [Corynebacterium alimapuense]RNE49410.1 M23 family peptidase [Corynebacterium alimapuense]
MTPLITKPLSSWLVAVTAISSSLWWSPPAAAYVDPSTGHSTAQKVIRAFDKPEHNWLPGHRGVDLALEVGEPVLAAGSGVVVFAGNVAGTPTVSIDHSDGVRTTYQPVFPSVVEGEHVTEGSEIGSLAHATDGWEGLQWGARSGPARDEYLNPLSLLELPTIRLKQI